jgi:hypothetical protein
MNSLFGGTSRQPGDRYYDRDLGRFVTVPTPKSPTTPTTPAPPPTPTYARPVNYQKPAAYDFLLGSSPYLTSRTAAGQNELRITPLDGVPAIRCDLVFRDFSAGLDMPIMEIGEGDFPGFLSFSELEHRYSRTLSLLPLEEVITTAAKLMGAEEALHVAYVRGDTQEVIAGGGSTANQALFKLGNASNLISVTALTYTPGSVITCLATIQQETAVDRLLVGRAGAAPQILSGLDDSTPVTDATMHANLTPCWGMIASPLNSTTPGAGTNLFYANNGIWVLSTTATPGTAPTQALSNWPDGGYALDKLMIEGSVHRAYWYRPDEDLGTTHVLAPANSTTGHIISTNFEGLDPQVVETALDFLIHAMVWRNGLVYTDGQTAIWHNGQEINLGWNRDRRLADDRQAHIVYFEVIKERLLAKVAETDADGNVQAVYYEEYIPEENAWYRITKAVDPGTTTRPGVAPAGRSAVYHSADSTESATFGNRLFWYQGSGTEGWYSISILPPATNPFYWQNTGESYRYFATVGTARTPVYHLFEGLPKLPAYVWCGGEMKGEDSKVKVEIASQSASAMVFTGNMQAEFYEDDDWRRHRKRLRTAEMVDRLQFQFTVTQGTSGSAVTRTSPNMLPVVVTFYVMLDGQYHSPAELEPDFAAMVSRMLGEP